jgi:hypothetical protein
MNKCIMTQYKQNQMPSRNVYSLIEIKASWVNLGNQTTSYKIHQRQASKMHQTKSALPTEPQATRPSSRKTAKPAPRRPLLGAAAAS